MLYYSNLENYDNCISGKENTGNYFRCVLVSGAVSFAVITNCPNQRKLFVVVGNCLKKKMLVNFRVNWWFMSLERAAF